MDVRVKREALQTSASPAWKLAGESVSVIDLSSSSSDSDLGERPNVFEDVGSTGGTSGSRNSPGSAGRTDSVGAKRVRETYVTSSELERKSVKKISVDDLAVVLPEGFGQSEALAVQALPAPPLATVSAPLPVVSGGLGSCKSFWKAGDYEGSPGGDWDHSSGGLDHVRVHPKFLHSNATSHKWALGAFAELLDNALDEVASGATYVNIDMIQNRKDGSRMLLVEDNGGGMDPDKMRQCMSLGYSAKSKLANTIGQYGNGFKTSTMRLGADVIVFSRCPGKDGNSSTESIGLLSYTFLRSTGKEDIVVPMLDYERRGPEWKKILRSTPSDWNKNVETVVQWSPFSSEEDLLRQFNLVKDRGTRIFIYNLWEDDQGMLELDFDADPNDIQLRGVNRDEKNIQMASKFPNSRHFLTYKHSLRSYVSILYLRIPPGFRIILRGRDVEHHNIVNDMMQTEQVTYRPQYGADGVPKDSNMSAVVTIGFVKDAKHHVDVQGFNVYHKNRLIKPFWRIWNASGSDGRGVIGVLEANFVEPAHDKQGFERTTVLARLEARLVQMQKNYWSTNCHKIGYAPRRSKKSINASDNRESSPEYDPEGSARSSKRAAPSSVSETPFAASDKLYSSLYAKNREKGSGKYSKGVTGVYRSGLASDKGGIQGNITTESQRRRKSQGTSPSFVEGMSDEGDDDLYCKREVSGLPEKDSEPSKFPAGSRSLHQLEQENEELRERLKRKEEVVGKLQEELKRERERCKALEARVEEGKKELEEMSKEQESLLDIFAEERGRRDEEEDALREKLEKASNSMQEMLEKIKKLEGTSNRRR